VRRGGEAAHLTPTEWRLLEALASAPGKLRTHVWLLEQVWGDEDRPDVEALRVFVSQLRRKVEPDPRRPRVIRTEPGVGYRWQLEPV
jgi:two-component system KDP operon response regulator KdpE